MMITVTDKPTYMRISKAAEIYGLSDSTIRRHLREIEKLQRYKDAWPTINDEGDKLVNTLVLEDYMRHSVALKNPNLARRLKPFDEAAVMKHRGGFIATLAEILPDREILKDIITEIMEESSPRSRYQKKTG